MRRRPVLPGIPWTLTIEGLANGVTYNLAVTALNEEGMSPLSAEVQGTPPGGLGSGSASAGVYPHFDNDGGRGTGFLAGS